MTLRQLRDRLSLAQVGIAIVAVALGGGVQWWSVALLALFSLWAFMRPLPSEPSRRSSRTWTAVILVALVATLARAFVRAEFLDAGVDFLLLLVAQRLFNRQRAREHLQLLMLGLLLMVVAAVVNTGLNFPLLFAAYLLAAVATLIVNHLLSEGERLGPRVAAEVGRAGMRARHTLMRSAGSVAAMAAVGGLLVFLLFPRWGMGVFLRGPMARDTQSGFSGEVQLGGFGRIKTDTTVVARIRPTTPLPREDRLDWHLRGSSLDRYESGRWSHGRKAERTPLRALGPYQALAPADQSQLEVDHQLGRHRTYAPAPIDGYAASQQQLRAEVILEDLGVDVLFIPSDPVAARVARRGALEQKVRLRGGLNREIHVDKPPGPIQYEFISRPEPPTVEELRTVGDPAQDDSLRPYLQRPPGLSADFTALAQRLTQGHITRYDKVAAVMAHLSSFQYSLELQAPEGLGERDPIEGFVFQTRSGHCEYFASALALLLREVDIPTRIVNGYYGAQYNAMGDFYSVRQADAHSWVEVHFGPLGWVTFDPTPPAGRAAGANAGLFPALNQAVDALRNAYLEYVIDYNLTKQISLLENLGVSRGGPSRRFQVAWKTVATWLAPLLAVAVALFVLRRRRRRNRRSPEAVLYARIGSRLAALGHPRRAQESAHRYARRLQAQNVRGASVFEKFAECYERVRFGPERSDADVMHLRKLAREVLRQLR